MSADDFSQIDIDFHRQTAVSYDEDVTAEYAVYHRYMLDPYLDRVASSVGAGRAVDIGCGTGVIALGLARRGLQVVGIDHSKEMLEIAEAKRREAGLANCDFVRGDARELPLADETVDCVTCQGVLHHLQVMDDCLRELQRVLRPGGFFYISEPCQDRTPLKRVGAAIWRVARLRRHRSKAHVPQSVEAPISAAELRGLLTRLGLEFEMEFLTHFGPLRSVLPDNAYLALVRAASRPWRKVKGDLVFVFGRKPIGT